MRLSTLLVLVAFAGAPASATAQAQPAARDEASPSYGWTINPTLTVGQLWDNNALVQGNADGPTADYVSIFTPSASIDYRGRKSDASLAYTGGYSMYQTLTSLNSFDQSEHLSTKRHISRRTLI